MGAVYRATDTKLERDVALKILPDVFASDPERLAALNHPSIAQIYGIESNALVMELVDGEDLAAIIARGPLPVADALPLAKQIAEALEAAHEQGIIHRDLKPANIILKGARGPTPTRLPDGSRSPTIAAADVAGCTVKVLDFGLAKAFAGPEGPAYSGAETADAMNSPTLTAAAGGW
jgi:serine/threonine-protein kinase